MINVSVIVPVYNVQDYLEQCLDGLVNQTLQSIEIIVVNDGSKDNSQEIIDKYASEYDSVKAYIKENGGLSDARNYGLQYATGEYIGFVDSDDYVDKTMYEKLYKKAKEKDYDVVECDLVHTWNDRKSVEVGKRIVDKKEMLMIGRSVVWNKIYKHDWLQSTGVTFHAGKIYEDVEFFLKLIPFINEIAYVEEGLIYYRQREDSLNTSYNIKTMDILDILESIRIFYRKNGYYDEYKEALEYFYIRILLGSSFKRMVQIAEKETRKKALKTTWLTLNDKFPHWKKNKYLKESKGKKTLFQKSVTSISYPVYCSLIPMLIALKGRLRKK